MKKMRDPKKAARDPVRAAKALAGMFEMRFGGREDGKYSLLRGHLKNILYRQTIGDEDIKQLSDALSDEKITMINTDDSIVLYETSALLKFRKPPIRLIKEVLAEAEKDEEATPATVLAQIYHLPFASRNQGWYVIPKKDLELLLAGEHLTATHLAAIRHELYWFHDIWFLELSSDCVLIHDKTLENIRVASAKVVDEVTREMDEEYEKELEQE